MTLTTLRRWDTSGKLRPVRHPSSGYRYYRQADLEPFRLDYTRAGMSTQADAHLFQLAVASIEGNERLREPQQEAHKSVRDHFATSSAPAIIQVPVGCGKTGIIATLPFGIARGRVLVIAPNLTIRKTISEALDISGSECFWSKTRVLGGFRHGPYVAVLDGPTANIHDCTESHFVVTNIQQLASSADRWLPQFPPNFFDMILVDEAHHNIAASWRKVFLRFPDAKVVGLTATPFRSDEQPLAGEIIYRYSFTRAMMKGYIKQLHSSNVAPSEIYFTYHGDTRHHTLEEVLELREEQWFRRGIALSEECNRHIAESSIQRCRTLREQTGTQHQIIAAACSVDHARQVRAIYEECGLKAKEIYSELPDDEKETIIAELKSGRLDCIVQVQMLGEGFDHPRLSVAAIFRPFGSLAPYIQFVGRVMRVIHQNEPGHADNQGFIVSHVGLNNDTHWGEFRELDLDDQRLFHNWVTASPEATEGEGNGGGGPRRFDLGMRVDNELVSHWINQPFLDPSDDRVLDKILNQKLGGMGVTVGSLFLAKMTREEFRKSLQDQQQALKQTPTEIPISPQRRRQSAKTRLAERTGSVAARILQDLGVARGGRDVSKSTSNYQAVIKTLNSAVNKAIGIKSGQRNSVKADQVERALADLDRIGDGVRDEIKRAMGGRRG